MERKYKFIDDIEIHKEKNQVVIIGSRKINEYIKMKCDDIESINKLINSFDGINSYNEINLKCKEFGISVNLDKFISEMDKKGMFTDSIISNSMDSEINMLGVSVFQKKFNNMHVKNTSLYKGIAISIFSLIIASLVYLILNRQVVDLIRSGSFLKFNESYALGMLLTLLLSTIILMFHEIGHVIFASMSDMPVESFGLTLYLGFLPKWYVKFRSIRIGKKYKRLATHSGGVIMNLLLILLSAVYVGWGGNVAIIRPFILSNALMIVNCLIPFSLTDGYFLFSDIFNISNLRKSMFNDIGKLMDGRFGEINKKLLLYLAISLSFYIYKIIILYYWMFKSLLEFTKLSYIIIIILTMTHFYLLLKRISTQYSIEQN